MLLLLFLALFSILAHIQTPGGHLKKGKGWQRIMLIAILKKLEKKTENYDLVVDVVQTFNTTEHE